MLEEVNRGIEGRKEDKGRGRMSAGLEEVAETEEEEQCAIDETSRRESMCWLECNGTSRAGRTVQIHVTMELDAGKTGKQEVKERKKGIYTLLNRGRWVGRADRGSEKSSKSHIYQL